MFYLRNDLSFEHDTVTVAFTKILLLKTYQMRSLLIDWLLINYLRKRFCYFIFMSRQVGCRSYDLLTFYLPSLDLP